MYNVSGLSRLLVSFLLANKNWLPSKGRFSFSFFLLTSICCLQPYSHYRWAKIFSQPHCNNTLLYQWILMSPLCLNDWAVISLITYSFSSHLQPWKNSVLGFFFCYKIFCVAHTYSFVIIIRLFFINVSNPFICLQQSCLSFTVSLYHVVCSNCCTHLAFCNILCLIT